MNLIGRIFSRIINSAPEPKKSKKNPPVMNSEYGNTYSVSYNGEINKGEIGPVINYEIQYQALANRSWQAYLESDIAVTVLDKYVSWVVDKGLKLEMSPDKIVLESEEIKIDTETFNNSLEARFKIWSNSKHSSFSGEKTANQIAIEAYKNAKVGGDVLVILRYVDKTLKIQLVDGRHVQSPFNWTGSEKSKNKMVNGIEMNSKGEHVKYHVKKRFDDYAEVKAFDEKTGLRRAFLVYGSRYRLDDHRGLPKIAASLETIAKIDRYKEAAVGSAEERAKIVYAIEHDLLADGESPLDPFAEMVADNDDGTVPVDSVGNAMADKVTATTNKQTFNLAPGSKLKALESKSEALFTDFWKTNADIICAAMSIPPNVAFSLYTDSFSASRAATKDWDKTLIMERDFFKVQYFSYVLAFFTHFEILNSKIKAPGYLQAFEEKNWMVVESYLNCRFVGPMFPHIDPLKEVKAERLKLGSTADDIPLTTIEAATEAVGSGESNSNMDQYAEELEKSITLKISTSETNDPDTVE